MIKRFNRFELKYIIDVHTAAALVDEIAPYVRPDPEGGPTGTYQVTSLYFDTSDARFYRAKLDGLKFRRKLRIRRYGTLTQASDTTVAVEIKQRINRTTQKRRVALPLPDAFALCEGRFEGQLDDADDAQIASEVHFLARALVLRPSCTVSYIRQAFMGLSYQPGVRITFDRSLWCRDPVYGFLPDGPRHEIISPSRVVLEVKVNDAVPQWITRLLARYDCGLNRFSKYCTGLWRLRQMSRPVIEEAEHG